MDETLLCLIYYFHVLRNLLKRPNLFCFVLIFCCCCCCFFEVFQPLTKYETGVVNIISGKKRLNQKQNMHPMDLCCVTS